MIYKRNFGTILKRSLAGRVQRFLRSERANLGARNSMTMCKHGGRVAIDGNQSRLINEKETLMSTKPKYKKGDRIEDGTRSRVCEGNYWKETRSKEETNKKQKTERKKS